MGFAEVVTQCATTDDTFLLMDHPCASTLPELEENGWCIYYGGAEEAVSVDLAVLWKSSLQSRDSPSTSNFGLFLRPIRDIVTARILRLPSSGPREPEAIREQGTGCQNDTWIVESQA